MLYNNMELLEWQAVTTRVTQVDSVSSSVIQQTCLLLMQTVALIGRAIE